MPNPYLPQETLDHIVDFLHDQPEALKACSLASKRWIPRTRKHLFAEIEFKSPEHLKSWWRAFPDPSNSPAHHTHTTFVRCTQLLMIVNARAGGLIQTFSRVARLRLDWITMDNNRPMTARDSNQISLAPFHQFSSTLKSLRMRFHFLPYPEIFDLVRSSPLLEDFALSGRNPSSSYGGDIYGQRAAIRSTSPAFTGCLDLRIRGGMEHTTRRLLDLPGGLHFRKLVFSCFQDDDLRWIAELVTRCTNTLECFEIDYRPLRASGPLPVDLSRMVKLRDVVFRPRSSSVTWVTVALQTITTRHRDLQHISIHALSSFAHIDRRANINATIGERIYGQWLDLDRLLVHFWESRSIRPRVVYTTGEVDTRFWIGRLLPEARKRGIVDMIYCSGRR